MKRFEVSPDVSRDEFLGLCADWDAAGDCFLCRIKFETERQVRSCANIAIDLANFSFSMAVLEEVAGAEITPFDILIAIFTLGDQGCIETICMRKNLSDEIKNLCNCMLLVHDQRGLHKAVD